MKLTPFSYAVLVLVGEGGAGAHDLVRMMREGQYVFWAAATSQWYAEPKRLAELGLLHAERTPGRTHDRTHYQPPPGAARRRRARGLAGRGRGRAQGCSSPA